MQIRCSFELDESAAAAWQLWTVGRPLLQPAWLNSWWSCFSDGNQPYFMWAVDEHDKPLALLPWYRESDDRRGRVLRFLGSSRVPGPDSKLLTDDQDRESVTTGLAHHLLDMSSDPDFGWDALELNRIDVGDRFIPRLLEFLLEEGASVQGETDETMCRYELPRTWSELHSARSPELDRELARFEQALLTDRNSQMQLQTDQYSVLQDVDQLVRFAEANGLNPATPAADWSGLSGQFLQSAVRGLKPGSVRTLTTRLHDRAIAVWLEVLHAGRWLCVARAAESFRSDVSMTSFATKMVIEHALSQRRRSLEILDIREEDFAIWPAQSLSRRSVRLSLKRSSGPPPRLSFPVEGMNSAPSGGMDLTGMH